MTRAQEDRVVAAAETFGDLVHAFFVPIACIVLAIVVTFIL